METASAVKNARCTTEPVRVVWVKSKRDRDGFMVIKAEAQIY
jgi:hypothetical protein